MDGYVYIRRFISSRSSFPSSSLSLLVYFSGRSNFGGGDIETSLPNPGYSKTEWIMVRL